MVHVRRRNLVNVLHLRGYFLLPKVLLWRVLHVLILAVHVFGFCGPAASFILTRHQLILLVLLRQNTVGDSELLQTLFLLLVLVFLDRFLGRNWRLCSWAQPLIALSVMVTRGHDTVSHGVSALIVQKDSRSNHSILLIIKAAMVRIGTLPAATSSSGCQGTVSVQVGGPSTCILLLASLDLLKQDGRCLLLSTCCLVLLELPPRALIFAAVFMMVVIRRYAAEQLGRRCIHVHVVLIVAYRELLLVAISTRGDNGGFSRLGRGWNEVFSGLGVQIDCDGRFVLLGLNSRLRPVLLQAAIQSLMMERLSLPQRINCLRSRKYACISALRLKCRPASNHPRFQRNH